MEFNYCRRCGATLTSNGGNSYTCANAHVIFHNPCPTMSAFIITPDGNVVLGRRCRDPHIGKLDSIGGFVDRGETFESAASREVLEESSLRPGEYGPFHYLGSATEAYEYADEVHPVVSNIFWTALRTTRTLNPGDDIVEIGEFPIDSETLARIGATDVRAGFQMVIDHKDDILRQLNEEAS